MSALSDLLNRYLAKDKFKDLSNRQIAEAADVSRGTIDNYRKGIHPVAPSEEILQAFHDLLGIPLVELREAAGVPRGEPEPYVAPAEFNRLSRPQRNALDEFVRSFIGPQGESNAVPSSSPPPPASLPTVTTVIVQAPPSVITKSAPVPTPAAPQWVSIYDQQLFNRLAGQGVNIMDYGSMARDAHLICARLANGRTVASVTDEYAQASRGNYVIAQVFVGDVMAIYPSCP